MKAPYPCERSHPALLYQTFAFISEKAYEDIPFITTFTQLVEHLDGMINGSTAGMGRRYDFAITRKLLRSWHVNGNRSTEILFAKLIWVGDEPETSDANPIEFIAGNPQSNGD